MMFVPRIWERSCVGVCFACGKILHGLLIQGDTLASTGSLGGASLSILLQAKCHYPLCQASSASCKCLETPGEESRDGLSHSLVVTVFWQDFTSQSKGLHMCLEDAHTIWAKAAFPWHWRQENPEVMMKDIFSPKAISQDNNWQSHVFLTFMSIFVSGGSWGSNLSCEILWKILFCFSWGYHASFWGVCVSKEICPSFPMRNLDPGAFSTYCFS